MKLASLFSGGKDSTYAAFLASKYGHAIECLISIESENKDSYMFHTPSISMVKVQAEAMNKPLILIETKGEKEKELEDLKKAIQKSIKKYKIEGIVTGAVKSVYQSSRIQKICNDLDVECFNPLWQKDQVELLNELVENKFDVIITGVFAYPLDQSWLGRKIDHIYIDDVKVLQKEYRINPAGEGGEFETFVSYCPLYEKEIDITKFEDSGEKNSWRREIKS